MEFSVLMSIYEKEKPEYFKACIESVLNQTKLPSEIVIVKDGPITKELDNLIEYYSIKYDIFKIIELDENKGLGVALAIGVESCSYDIIARMDTDDICVDNRFEKQINILNNNKKISIVGSYIYEFDGSVENIVSCRKVPIEEKDINTYIKYRNPFNHMTVMYRKSDVIKSGNYKDLLWNEDYYLWARMISNGCVGRNIPDVLVYARAGKGLFKRRGGFKYIRQEIKLQKEMYRLRIINILDLIFNISVRSIVRIVPNTFREIVYTKVLRK